MSYNPTAHRALPVINNPRLMIYSSLKPPPVLAAPMNTPAMTAAPTRTAKARPEAKAAAIKAERERCRQIIAAGIAQGQVNLAAAFAFESDITASHAVADLKACKLDRTHKFF